MEKVKLNLKMDSNNPKIAHPPPPTPLTIHYLEPLPSCFGTIYRVTP